jgi:hypothetical protein
VRAISVAERLPELVQRNRDINNLGHVTLEMLTLAIERASSDMVVSYAAGSEEVPPAASFSLVDDGHFVRYDGDAGVSSGGLERFGLSTMFGYAPSARGYVLFVSYDLKPLPDRTPGLIWVVDNTIVTFVSFDGETYAFNTKPDEVRLRSGAGAPEDWPAPVHNPAFGRAAFSVLRRKQTTPLEVIDDAFEQCADRAWNRAKAAMPPAQREADPVPQTAVIRAACKDVIVAWEKAFAANVDASVAERRAVYELAKKRLVAPRQTTR